MVTTETSAGRVRQFSSSNVGKILEPPDQRVALLPSSNPGLSVSPEVFFFNPVPAAFYWSPTSLPPSDL